MSLVLDCSGKAEELGLEWARIKIGWGREGQSQDFLIGMTFLSQMPTIILLWSCLACQEAVHIEVPQASLP